MGWQQLIIPVVVSGIVTGILAPLLFYFLNRRDQKQKRNFEIRHAKYEKYLGTLEDICERTRENLTKFENSLREIHNAMGSDQENVKQHISEMHDAFNLLLAETRDSLSRSNTDLRGLKLVCSEELLHLVNDLVGNQEALLNDSVAMIETFKRDVSEAEKSIPQLVVRTTLNAQLFDRILKQMRSELGIDGR